jgi:hypothetical protein
VTFLNWDDSSAWDSSTDTWDDLGLPPTPAPPTVGGQPTAGLITFYLYDLMTLRLLAELPLTGTNWSQILNAAGNFNGTLKLSDPGVQKLDPWDATRPGRTLLVIDVDGSIQWAGPIWTRKRTRSTALMTLGGNDGYSYFAQRLQALDYTQPTFGPYWSPVFGDGTPLPSDACNIAAQIVSDAMKVPGSAFAGAFVINILEAIPNSNLIAATYPISSLQTVDSIVTTLAGGGYETGFDFGLDASWTAGQGSTPTFALNISYPRRGRIAGSTGLVLDASKCTEVEWDEDATQQATSITGVASGTTTQQDTENAPAVEMAGYPRMEAQTNYSNINTPSALQSAVLGDLAHREWPVVTAVFTLPMFGDLAVGDFITGDDIRVIDDPGDMFPEGIDTYMRISGAVYTPADAGLSTMAITVESPPGLSPVPPPPL